MRVDVSEIKTYRQCPRKWQLSSRNQMHLRPINIPRHFTFGTIFHEALHQLYLGADPAKVLKWTKSQIDPNTPSELALPSMIEGYIENLLEEDLERYEVLEVEHHFEEKFTADAFLCGSIDMIAIDRETNTLVGFEHKTCKNFRTGAYLHLDDQLRVYNWVLHCMALRLDTKIEVGGIVLNETRKLLRKFENKRQIHNEPFPSLLRYINSLASTVHDLTQSVYSSYDPQPCADFMHCQMCEFNTICETYGTDELPVQDEILKEFELEFQERECDHLDEKIEREVMH